MFIVRIPWRNFHGHLLLHNFLYFGCYLFHHLHVWILLFSGGSMKVNLQMLLSWPNKSLGFLVFKLKQKRVFNLVGVLITLKCCRL
jgi:hypothetical protein